MKPAGSRKAVKKGTSSGGYRRLLRWAALPITDRRWAAPLSALALGFGLFVGVAIGPGAAGTFATGAAQIIEIPGFSGGTDDSVGMAEGGGPSPSGGTGDGGGGGSSIPTAESTLPPIVPITSSEGEGGSTPAAAPASPEEPAPAAEEPEPEEETLAGIVVHVNPAAASYTIAEPAGTLDVVHAAKAPPPGAKVSVPVRLLSNGTFAEGGKLVKSAVRTRATFSGIVTYVDPSPIAPAYTVSKRGVSALVHVHPDPTGAVPPLPVLGAFASVAVDIEKPTPPPAAPEAPLPPVEPTPPPVVPSEPAPAAPAPAPPTTPSPAPLQPTCAPDPAVPTPPPIQLATILWQRQVKAQGAPFTASDFAGIVTAICPDSAQMLISADDIRESSHDLTFAVPATIDLTKVEVGQSVLATATISPEGALSLTGLASDERTKGAEDAKTAQGDLVSTPSQAPERSSR